MFAKRLELLKCVNDEYQKRGEETINAILEEHPYDDLRLGR